MLPIPSSLTLSAGALLVGFTAGWYVTADYKDAKLAEAMLANARTVDKLEAKAEARIEDAKNEYVATITKIKHSADSLNDELGRLRVTKCEAVPRPARRTERVVDTPSSPAVGNGAVEVNLDRVAGEIIRLGSDLDQANTQITGLQSVVKACIKMSYDK